MKLITDNILLTLNGVIIKTDMILGAFQSFFLIY